MSDYFARSAMLRKTQPITTPATKTKKISSARDNEKCQSRKVMVTTSVFCKVKSATISNKPRPVSIRSLIRVLECISLIRCAIGTARGPTGCSLDAESVRPYLNVCVPVGARFSV